jgi:hypothetical protein
MLAALDALIGNGTGGRRVQVLKQVCDLFLTVGFSGDGGTSRQFDELMATLAMDLDSDTLAVLAPELSRLPGVLPGFSATVMSRFHEIAQRMPPEDLSVQATASVEAPEREDHIAETSAGISVEMDVVPAPDHSADGRSAPQEPPAPPADRRSAPRDPAGDSLNPLTLARRASPAQLLEMARLPNLPDVLTSILVSRGDMPSIVAALRNPAATFPRSSLTTLAELAAGDRDLRNALQDRPDLPEPVIDRLLPILGREARARLLMSGPVIGVEEARMALADADADITGIQRGGVAAVALDVLSMRVNDGEISLDDAITALAREGRLAEMAAFAAVRLSMGYTAAYAILCARLDHPAAILMKALGCTEKAAEAAMDLRRRCGMREARETKSAVYIFARIPQEEARVVITLIDRATTEREIGAEQMMAGQLMAEAYPLALAG